MDFKMIVLLAIIAISVISSIVKNKKKSDQKKKDLGLPPVTPEVITSEEKSDPWEWLGDFLERAEGAEGSAKTEEGMYDEVSEEPEEVFSYDKQSMDEIALRKKEYSQSADSIRHIAFVGDITSGDNAKGGDPFNEKDVEIGGNKDDSNSVFDDFDVRAAVLYSEILKPKFEE